MPCLVRGLSIFLLAVVAMTVLTAYPTPATGTQVSGATQVVHSAVNKVPDFYAEGKSDNGYSLKITPEGGYLSSSGPTISLTPWSYVTSQWSIGTVYIILLANVTQTDFYIAFLYLTNSSTPFLLRTFEYKGPNTNTLTFTGIQYVFARTTTTNSIPMPNIQIRPEAKANNDLSAIGPEVYINGNSGQIINGSQSLKLFPLRTQYFQGASDYNELWSLLTDDSGNYFFAILYMPNNNPNQIIIEHRLRLNDYTKLSGEAFDAKWRKGSFTGRITVRLPIPNGTVRLEGFPFRADTTGVVWTYVPQGTVSVEVPNQTSPSPGVRYLFTSWKNRGTANPLTLSISSPVEVEANYRKQFLLTLQSEFGPSLGAGWYDENSNVTFSVPGIVPSDSGTRRVFDHWTGDFNSASNNATITMNSPTHVTAIWRTQFKVTLQLSGVAENASATVAVNGQPEAVTSQEGYEFWADANTQISISVQTAQIPGSDANYNFVELRVDDSQVQSEIAVTRPIAVQIVYSQTPKVQSAIVLRVSPDTVPKGYPVTVSGSAPAEAGRPSVVTLYYGGNDSQWQFLSNVTTRSDGSFTYVWKPEAPGDYLLRAYWSGDQQHSPASKVVSVRVQESPASDLGGSPDMATALQNFVSKVRALPLAAAMLELAGSLLALGLALAGLLVPGGSSIVGYFIGSTLIGLVFIFPISAIVFALKAARSRRSPSAVWLTPLATVWLVALLMLTTGGTVFVLSPVLLDAAALLLISSNLLFVPLCFSLILAKIIAG